MSSLISKCLLLVPKNKDVFLSVCWLWKMMFPSCLGKGVVGPHYNHFQRGNTSATLSLKTLPSAPHLCSQRHSSSSPSTTPAPPGLFPPSLHTAVDPDLSLSPFLPPIISTAKARGWWSWTHWICHCEFGKRMSGCQRVGIQQHLCSKESQNHVPSTHLLGMQPELCPALGMLLSVFY